MHPYLSLAFPKTSGYLFGIFWNFRDIKKILTFFQKNKEYLEIFIAFWVGKRCVLFAIFLSNTQFLPETIPLTGFPLEKCIRYQDI